MEKDLTEDEKTLICNWLERFDSVSAQLSLEAFTILHNLNPKPKLELNRWIASDKYKGWIIYLDGDSRYYGSYSSGEWFEHYDEKMNLKSIKRYNLNANNRYATDEEIKTALTKEAIKRGYDKKHAKCLRFPKCIERVDLEDCKFETTTDGNFWISDKKQSGYIKSNCIFKNGEWAEFIDTELTEMEQAYKELGEKIEAYKNR